MSSRSSRRRHAKPEEPLILWWMPVVALLAPLLVAAWLGVSADNDALESALVGFFWPGVLVYGATVIVLWAGWKIELE